MKHVLILLILAIASVAGGESGGEPAPAITQVSRILGRPSDRSVAISLLSPVEQTLSVEYGPADSPDRQRSQPIAVRGGTPTVIDIAGLAPDTAYAYRLHAHRPGETVASAGPQAVFRTQRAPGRSFAFSLQGDSHPERDGRMYNPGLYAATLRLVADERPDFHIMLGDDFSLERLIERHELSQANADRVYAHQRSFLDLIGSSSPVFLVNGNHEQAARHWLDGSATNPAVLAGRARNAFFPLPAPDAFYSGDAEEVQHIGLLRDYYAWTWGDALFAVIDPYWHSPVEVDHGGATAKGGKGKGRDAPPGANAGRGETDPAPPAGRRDLWQVTLGDAQYRWLHDTLLGSTARWKFVFAHHVMGTGRGGIEMARLYEWGGRDRRGAAVFAEKRPGWDLPIHDLFVKAGVTIFFQGHDHLFARQSLDGVVYQSVPNPADPTYQAFNRDAYATGDTLPNSGHLRITVSPERVAVDYIRSFLAADATGDRRHGMVAFSYAVGPGAAASATSGGGR